ncbi:MAG: hypothetical protein ACOX1U_03315 [Saccharofermentanales bacterium]|jgi:hypothetical protein
MKIQTFLLDIKNKLQEGRKDNEFSYYVEDTLATFLDMFIVENESIALEMNDTLPDICEQMEPGMESDKFHMELSNEINRLLALLEE